MIVFDIRPGMNIFVIVVGALLGSQFLAGVHAKLYQPVVTDSAVSYSTVWDFARECDRRNGSLPEIANDQDLKDFTSALSKISLNLLDGKKFYLGISRWDDVLNGNNNRTYTDPETGKPLPMPDKNFWDGTDGLPSNGDGSKEFFTIFWSSGIFLAGSKLNDAEAKNSYSAILACSLNAPKRTCPPPPRHPAAKLAIWINAPSQDAQEYPYGTRASYWCPLGFAMSHTAMLALSTRSIEVQCYGALGWGPATVNWEDVNRPVNMTCVLEPRTIWVIMNGVAGKTEEYMFVYQANKQGSNASSVMEQNKQCQYSAAWLYGLETFKGLNNAGKPPSHVNFVGTNFTVPILDTLDFYAAAGHKVALALNIRADYDAEADIQAQYAIVQSAWQKVSQRIGRPILDPLLPEGDTNQKLCSIYASDENGTIGIQPVSCTSPIDGTQFQLCHRFEQGCTLGGNQPLPFFIRNSWNTKVTFSTSLDPLLGYPISTKASYTCARCVASFDRPVTTAPSVTCNGSMGWEPIEGLPRCISNPGRAGVNLDAGPVFKAVPPNAANFLAAANLCNSQQPGAGLVTINSKEDLLTLQDFLNETCFQGMLPIGNNILSADPIGSMHTNVTLKSAWNATFTAFAPPWFAGFPVFNQTGNQGMCAVLRSRTDASTNRVPTWGLENFPCESTATASFLLCQNGTGVCSTMRVNDTTTTVNYTDPSGALNETHFPHGAIAHIHCKRPNNWWKSSYAFNKPRFICYGSMGWYPRITDDCAGLRTSSSLPC